MGQMGSSNKTKVDKLIHSLFIKLLDSPQKAPMLTKIARERLERMLSHYQNEGHTLAFAVVDTVREVLFDNVTSADWALSPFSKVKLSLAKIETLAPLPPSAFPAPPTPPPAGLGTYLKATLPSELFTLLQFVLHYGCRADETDELFSLPRGTSSDVLAQQLVALGVYERRGHDEPSACWPLATLRFVTKEKKPKCKACRKSAVRVFQLAALLAPEECTEKAPPKTEEKPKKKHLSKPTRIRPLRSHLLQESKVSFFSARNALVLFVLSTILTTPVLFLKGNVATARKDSRISVEKKLVQHIAHCPTTGKKLTANSEIQAGTERPYFVQYKGKINVVLRPGSSARVVEDGIELISGGLSVDVPEACETPFKLSCGFFTSPLAMGRFLANRTKEEAKISVYKGETKVTLSGVVNYSVETLRQATVDGEGHIKICDLETPLPDWLAKWYAENVLSKGSSIQKQSTKTMDYSWAKKGTKFPSFGPKKNRKRRSYRRSAKIQGRKAKGSDFYRHLF